MSLRYRNKTLKRVRVAALCFCASFADSLSILPVRRPRSSVLPSPWRPMTEDDKPTYLYQLYQSRLYGESSERANALVDEAETTKRKVFELLKLNEFGLALASIKDMMSSAGRMYTDELGEEYTAVRMDVCSLLDETIQGYASLAFSSPYRGARSRERVLNGLGAVQLQLSSSGVLLPPYNTCTKATLILALKAISGVIASGLGGKDSSREPTVVDDAFRILQRLVTGMGVRHAPAKESAPVLSDREFNMVLNAVCNAGRMDIAEKIVGLQERTPNAPPLSPVSYSILLKGYGRSGDTRNVEMTLLNARNNDIQPDTIMMNSAMDAFINCGQGGMARDIFDFMTVNDLDVDRLSRLRSLFLTEPHPHPNGRTYNTMLKGFARQGDIESALEVASRMRDLDIWDCITTNTLVSAALATQDFALAESVLQNHTSAPLSIQFGQGKKHPNVEAYTDLLDAYAKASQVENALGVLNVMRQRGVQPNEYTYTCVISTLARAKRVDQTRKLLKYMENDNVKPNTAMFNAFISGLVSHHSSAETHKRSELQSDSQLLEGQRQFDGYVNEAITVLRSMLNKGVRPNSATISVLVDAFGRCEPPRVGEAKALVRKLEVDGIISGESQMIATSLVRTCSLGRDLKGAVESFGKMTSPDTVAVNAFMEACCQCQHEQMAFDTFEHFFGEASQARIQPDVISYTVLIKNLLKHDLQMSVERTRRLYNEMKNQRRIRPDKVLVDIILKAMIRAARVGLQKKDIEFSLNVVRDAKGLEWAPGEYERRKQAVRAVVIGRLNEIRNEDEGWFGMRSIDDDEEEDDPLLSRHGWNKVDSGFSVWGRGSDRSSKRSKSDDFLRDDWNDVDSGFRII